MAELLHRSRREAFPELRGLRQPSLPLRLNFSLYTDVEHNLASAFLQQDMFLGSLASNCSAPPVI